MKRGFAALAVVGIAAAVAVFAFTQSPTFSGMNLHSNDHTFNSYIAKHGKSYANKEDYEYRREIFNAQMAEITLHNSQNDKSWFMGVNKFTDMTPRKSRCPSEVVSPASTDPTLRSSTTQPTRPTTTSRLATAPSTGELT